MEPVSPRERQMDEHVGHVEAAYPAHQPEDDDVIEVPPPAKRAKKDFRFRGKKLFLTISQVDWTPQQALEHIKKKWPLLDLEYYVVQEKHHPDANAGRLHGKDWAADPDKPNLHIHAFIRVRGRGDLDCTSNKIGGVVANFKTPQGASGMADCVRYMQKDGEAPSVSNISFAELKTAKNFAEFLELFGEKYGELKMILGFQQLQEYWRFVQNKPDELNYLNYERWMQTHETVDNEHTRELERWVQENVRAAPIGKRLPILVLVGPSQIGKTTLVRGLLPKALYVRSAFDANALLNHLAASVPAESRAQALILDDLLPDVTGGDDKDPEKAWCGELHSEYQGTGKWLRFPKLVSVPTVILSNNLPSWTAKPYWQKNIVLIHITSDRPLFKVRLQPYAGSIPAQAATPAPPAPPSQADSFPELPENMGIGPLTPYNPLGMGSFDPNIF